MEFFDNRIIIFRKDSGIVNAAGESEEAWIIVATFIRANINPIKSVLRVTTPGMQIIATHNILVDAKADIESGDKIIDKTGKEFIVESKNDWLNFIHCTGRII